jgi:potassium-transporting ATPase KdpC subunit
MKHELSTSIRLTLVCAIIFCGVYTIVVYGVAQLAPQHMSFSKNDQGMYNTVGQLFTSDKYFWSRPSAVNYNAAGSGGSNKGPSNQEYLQQVRLRIDTFLLRNPTVHRDEVPADIVTASGSGLDPHISVQAARVQVARVATARGLKISDVLHLVDKHVEKPLWGLFGPEKINVLELNIALNAL